MNAPDIGWVWLTDPTLVLYTLAHKMHVSCLFEENKPFQRGRPMSNMIREKRECKTVLLSN